ncbi:MAG: hypothetical protein Kow0022_18210 [Phycisphaerales bacterium]
MFPPDSARLEVSGLYTARGEEAVVWGAKMLVITRREGEEVVIGDPKNPIGIVRIASVKGERVRVAFEFPREIEIHRREIADQIVDEGTSATADVIGEIKPVAAAGIQ